MYDKLCYFNCFRYEYKLLLVYKCNVTSNPCSIITTKLNQLKYFKTCIVQRGEIEFNFYKLQ